MLLVLTLPVLYKEKGCVSRPTTEPCDLLDFRSVHSDPADRQKRRSANIDGRQECKLARLEEEKALIACATGQMIAGMRTGLYVSQIVSTSRIRFIFFARYATSPITN